MRIATKISAGYIILIALMVVMLIYHVSLIHRMETINRHLTDVNFNTARVSLQLAKDLDQIEDFTKRFFVTQDSDYISGQKEWCEVFVHDLQRIRLLDHSDRERAEIERLSQMWDEFSAAARERLKPSAAGADREDSRSVLLGHLSRLQTQTDTVFEATKAVIQSQVEESAEAGQQAEQIAWAAAAVALLVSILVSLLIVRSIAGPLRQLTEGTRVIAAGQFSYQLNASGTDEISELAKDFNTMAQRLEELDQMKKDFVSHVSHELKAPLASMQETTQLLLEHIPGPLTEKQQRLLRLNFQSGQRLSAMIANLLDLSRMEAGVMEYEITPQDLRALIRTAIAEFEPRAREKELRIEAELPSSPLVVSCDGDRLLQVIGNLLDNAFKFSPRGATIGVHGRLAATLSERIPESWRQQVLPASNGAGFAVVAVSDAGPGVPEPHKEKIFQKFHQIKQGGKVSGQGVGLGLAICRTIVEAHQGAIWVEDNPAGGSVFSVLLPMAALSDWAASRASSPI